MNIDEIRGLTKRAKEEHEAEREQLRLRAEAQKEVDYQKYRGANHSFVWAEIESQIQKVAESGQYTMNFRKQSYTNDDAWKNCQRLLREIAGELRDKGFRVEVDVPDNWSNYYIVLTISWYEPA